MQTIARAVTNGTTTHASGRDSCSDLEAPGLFHESRSGWLVLGVVWLASAGYLAAHLRQGWIPSDAGALAQSAERVLRGQVPYRDFTQAYTGGLVYLDALGFRLFGENLFSLRIPLFAFFLGWVPSVYFTARRLAAPLAAGTVTLLAVAWSVPNYPEAMPSWYNLFFATWGLLALIRFTETDRRGWLWVAGMTAGFSFLFKITALYFVAAALLFFAFREMLLSRKTADPSKGNGLFYRLFATTGLLAFLATVVGVVYERPTFTDFFYFVLPSASLVVFLVRETWQGHSDTSARRFWRLQSMVLPFSAGVVAPVAILLLWFARKGALGAWFDGVFLLAMRRTQWAALSPKSPLLIVGLLPMALVFVPRYRNRYIKLLTYCGVILALVGVLIACWESGVIYAFVGNSLPILVPLLTLVAALSLARRNPPGGRLRQQAFLVVAVGAVFSLIQFPYASPAYFFYIAPLAILALLALAALTDRRRCYSPWALWALLVFYLSFAVWLGTPGYYGNLHLPTRPQRPLSFRRLNLSRAGGIRAVNGEVGEYEALIAAVHEHARGLYIYATTDCPEVYFLSGEENPTPTLWEFLDPDFFRINSRTARILEKIESHHVSVVILHDDPLMSGPVPADLRSALDARFPESERVGEFEVRWK